MRSRRFWHLSSRMVTEPGSLTMCDCDSRQRKHGTDRLLWGERAAVAPHLTLDATGSREFEQLALLK
jgi:hypothetical protein